MALPPYNSNQEQTPALAPAPAPARRLASGQRSITDYTSVDVVQGGLFMLLALAGASVSQLYCFGAAW